MKINDLLTVSIDLSSVSVEDNLPFKELIIALEKAIDSKDELAVSVLATRLKNLGYKLEPSVNQ